DQVTGDKLLLFLRERVYKRSVRKRKRSSSQSPRKAPRSDAHDEAGQDGPDALDSQGKERDFPQTISWQTLETYTSALIDLYHQQANARVNSHPHPRTNAVKQLIETARKDQQT
ncbi:hypothetical protein OC846_006770, partial [Tilletia horrida]